MSVRCQFEFPYSLGPLVLCNPESSLEPWTPLCFASSCFPTSVSARMCVFCPACGTKLAHLIFFLVGLFAFKLANQQYYLASLVTTLRMWRGLSQFVQACPTNLLHLCFPSLWCKHWNLPACSPFQCGFTYSQAWLVSASASGSWSRKFFWTNTVPFLKERGSDE